MAQLGGVTPKSSTTSGKSPSIGGASPKLSTNGNTKVPNIGGVNVTINK